MIAWSTSRIWVLLTYPLKAERGGAEHKGIWNSELPLPLPGCALQLVWAVHTRTVLELVRQTASFSCLLLLMLGSWPVYAVYYESPLEGTGQGHCGGPRGF